MTDLVQGATRSKIVPCLWFDHGQARVAAEFYASIFPDSHVDARRPAPSDDPDGQQGHELTVEFTLLGMTRIDMAAIERARAGY
jgi:predicted 3-demethylubiquinone-9 3-methyltransferase (glyoxalase superfamily)